jgi:uncharacterized protein (DUF4415 family)
MSRKALESQQRDRLAKLAALPDEQIDTSDIPEASAESWAQARRPGLFRPIKTPVTIRLDADVLAWFREHAQGRGYQSDINRALRQHIEPSGRKRA